MLGLGFLKLKANKIDSLSRRHYFRTDKGYFLKWLKLDPSIRAMNALKGYLTGKRNLGTSLGLWKHIIYPDPFLCESDSLTLLHTSSFRMSNDHDIYL